MLEVGNGGMSAAEYRTHFSLWAILSAPLIAGNDLRNMSGETKELLMNKEVVAVDQDKLGHAGQRISKDDDLEVWTKSLDDGSYAVAFFNRGSVARPVSIRWSNLKLKTTPKLRDLWAHADRQSSQEGFTEDVPAHDVVLLRVFP